MQRAVAALHQQGSRTIFSGIQPTGIPHLGNYVGALRQWVRLQNQEPEDSKLVYSIVDLHAITVPQPPDKLRQSKREALAALLAIGIDPDRSTLFYQSAVSAHTELMWILSCTASVGYLSRMTQWKTKMNLTSKASLDDREAANSLKLGLFSYPVLQAADILVHRATHVPVGHDQQQHLEFARECVTNFNHAYGQHLVSPQTIVSPAQRIMSLKDPTSKMSKSAKAEKSRILITDTPEDIRTKVSSALTDSIPGVTYDPSTRPGIANLLDILAAFDSRQRSAAELASEEKGLTPRQLKSMVADAVIEGLEGVGQRYAHFLNSDDGVLNRVAEHGASKARKSAEETMDAVRSAVGF